MRVTELFLSVQGEGVDAGRLCTFMRFTACNVRCGYCDTPYSFQGGEDRTIDELVAEAEAHGAPMVCLTGGEPMLQRDIVPLMERLLERGFHVALETNGVIPLAKVPRAIVKVMDVKTPGAFRRPDSPPDFASSEAFRRMHLHYPNLETLTPNDQVKFVLCDREDYEWARAFMADHRLADRVAHVLLSPSHGQLDPRDLVAWMKEDRVPARLNLQAHKYIWGADVSGV